MALQGPSASLKRGCSSHGWGFIAPDVDDPPQCISMCRERFLRELLPKDETFQRVCEALEDQGHMDREQPFRALYCCDSQLCGVDNLGEGGKDHPGPPDADYICSPESMNGGDARCQKAQEVTSPEEDETTESAPRIPEATVSDAATWKRLTTSEASTTVPIQSSFPDTTYSTSSDPSLAASLDPSNRGDENSDGQGLPLGVKVAIVVVVVVISMVIAALVFCLLRRRRSRRSDIRRHIKHPTSPPPADSPTPLVSPTISHTDADGVPLTPPARLRERKFLPTLGEQSPSRQTGFPTSPLYSPTGSSMSPRHERTPRIYSAPAVPMIVMTAPKGGYLSQNDRFPSGIVTPPASAQRSLFEHSNGSPPRPLRSRDGPFKLSNLVSPGPPPTRALPSTPPHRPCTPTKPFYSPPRKGTSVASLVQKQAPDVARSGERSRNGIAIPSPTKGRNVNSPVMGETDLERLGGRY
ncbi:hypothetical protein FZEAL_4134 [Fusarium zealandicum]|uniref:Uncharacterized protein n=1 Tax=Fusarium zealandicum TaxID=1053134 RepID=A0A8H4UMH0_9HYPO|nr:hypothetical protein FZEAL_4134 [Fusarium zealandicum]